MSARWKGWLNWAGRGLALFGLIFVGIRLRDYGGQIDMARLERSGWLAILAMAAAYSLAGVALALAWRELLRRFGAQTTRSWAVRAYGLTQIAKYVPGNVFHLAGRQSLGMAAGIPAWPLLKSAAWEIGLIAFTGALFCPLALPAVVPTMPVAAAGAFFAVALLLAGALLNRFFGKNVARAFAWHALFFCITGTLFAWIVSLLADPAAPLDGFWILLAGCYVVAMIIGLLAPGAPAGLGVRELVLFFLLQHLLREGDLVYAILLGRVVTVTGDVLFFVWACGAGFLRRDRAARLRP